MTRAHPWHATILTLYPEMFPGPLGAVALGRCARAGRLDPGRPADPRARARPPSRGGRHAGRRRRRDGAALRRAGRGHRRGGARRPRPRLLMSPRGRPLTPGPGADLERGAGSRRRLRPVRGSRRAGDRRPQPRGGLDRRLRALGRRDRGPGAARRLRPPAPRRHGQGRLRASRRASRAGASNTRTTPGRANGRAAPIPDVLTGGNHAAIAALAPGGGPAPHPRAAAGPPRHASVRAETAGPVCRRERRMLAFRRSKHLAYCRARVHCSAAGHSSPTRSFHL